MTAKRKKMTRHLYLQALALFTMARTKYAEASRYDAELASLLGVDDGTGYAGCLSDAAVNNDLDFDGALREEGYEPPADLAKKKPA